MINVLLADDHKMFMEGMSSLLSDEENISIVGHALHGNEVLQIVDNQKVDLILLDVNMPDLDGIEISKQVKIKSPDTKILAVTMHNEESFLTNMIKNGASGYILKNTGKLELMEAITTVMQDKNYFSKEVTENLLHSMMPGEKKTASARAEEIKISRREKEVLKLICEEFTTPEIADKLCISLNTVESHRSNLLTKLNVRNLAGLVRVAINNRLID
ncbi:MAG: response regulator transcription factor [Cytophagales bacterium]